MLAVKKSVLTAIGKRKLELSNLEKVLFPEDHLTKSHLIAYYYRMAPTILTHLKGRPLSLVRFPDGIHGERWYQKRLPEFAPRWIDSIELGSEEKIRYVLCDEEACLCWLANLAAIEMHHTTERRPNFTKPDMMVFDLDPPESAAFSTVVEVAGLLRPRLEKLGYHPFVKTSGRKGIHVAVPIPTEDDIDAVVAAAQSIAKGFVDAHPKILTLQMKKEARGGKLFVDIYRNNRSQTVVAAYSVRAATGAPVSMPLEWSEIENLTDPAIWNTRTAPERIEQSGDAWQAFGAYAVRLHTMRSKAVPVTGEQTLLKEYERKRHFESTPEPGAEVAALSSGSAFVVHRHHASRLHYDLRLEADGVLRSWAVPKGLPLRPGIKRLAVATEDHPLPYLTFEGRIPAGQYGAGQMWVFASGRYEISKQKKDGFYFRLHSRELSGEYRIYKTSAAGKEHLIERVDSPQRDWLLRPPQPMLAEIADKLIQSDEFIYEVKWDGFRVFVAVDEGEVRMWSRGGNEITDKFPELQDAELFRASGALFDGEIVVLDERGSPQIDLIQQRFQSSKSKIERLSKSQPAVVYVFDCLVLDGRSIVDEPLMKRREWMVDAIRPATSFRVSEAFDDGEGLLQIVKKHGLEGLIAKRRESRYQAGRRSGDWQKIKVRETVIGIIVGFTRGEGDRADSFGALQIAAFRKGKLRYLGKVGTGFSDATLREIGHRLEKLRTDQRPISEKVEDETRTIWVKPEVVCQLSHSGQNEKAMREPVFMKLRPDLSPEDCREEEQER